MNQSITVAALLILLGFANDADADIGALNWLAGHWCGANRGVFNEEVWLAPRAGGMIGMHRDVKNERFAGFEFFRIVEDGADLVYWTQPGGQPAIAFRATTIGKDSIDFINAAHDFPKRIRYSRVDSHTLRARIDDGKDNGKYIEWMWTLECPERP